MELSLCSSRLLSSFCQPHTEIFVRENRFEKNDFDIKRTLGVGAYGFVKLVQWKRAPSTQSNVYYALKCVSKQNIERRNNKRR